MTKRRIWRKNKFIVLLVGSFITFFVFVSFAQEDDAIYRAFTKDGEVKDINQVEVKRYTPIVHTLEGCDRWIAEWQDRANTYSEHCLEQIEVWKGIRARVLEEAKKVKLKVLGDEA